MGRAFYRGHDPILPPRGWGEEGRLFCVRLERLFDDLYQRLSGGMSDRDAREIAVAVVAPEKERIDALESGKVDKVSGKGLSTNDFTSAYKTKVDNHETDIASLKTQKGNKAIYANLGTISSLPVTKNVAGVTIDMVCAEAVLGTPSAQVSDWTVNTDGAGKVTVSGTISGSTTLNVLLVPRDYKTAT